MYEELESLMALEYLFTRHGESLANLTRTVSNRVSDYAPLTERGRKQAEELLQALQNRRVAAIYASPLARARETAQILAAGLGLEAQIADALREPFCGIIEGRSDADAWRMHAEQEQAWRAGQHDFHIPEGESFNDVRARFLPFMEGVAARHREDTGSLVLVSHGSILINMLPRFLRNIDVDFARAHGLGNCAYVVAAPAQAGLVCLEWGGEKISFDR